MSEFASGGCSFGDCPGDSWLAVTRTYLVVVTRTYLVLDRSGPIVLNIPPVIEGGEMSKYGTRAADTGRTTCENVFPGNDGGGSSHALIASVHLTLVMLYFYSTISLL